MFRGRLNRKVKKYNYETSIVSDVCLILLAFTSLSLGTGNPLKPSLGAIVFSLYFLLYCLTNSKRITYGMLVITGIIFFWAVGIFYSRTLDMYRANSLELLYYYSIQKAGIAIVLSLTLLISALTTIVRTNNKVNKINEYSSDDEVLINPSKVTNVIMLMSKETPSVSSEDINKLYQHTNPEMYELINGQVNEDEPIICSVIMDDLYLKDASELSSVQTIHRRKMNIPFAYSSIFQPIQLSLEKKDFKVILETVVSSTNPQNIFTHNTIKPIMPITG